MKTLKDNDRHFQQEVAMLKYLGIPVLAALISAGGVFLLMRNNDGKTEVTVTIEGIKEIAQLATVEYTITDVIDWEKSSKWYEWANAHLMVTAKGIVKGSVDLGKMQIDVSTDPEKKSVLLHFEPGAILISNPEIGPDGIKFYTCSDPNIFNKVSNADRNSLHNQAVVHLKQAAIDLDIQEKTASEAKLVLTRFLRELGYEAVIEFAEEDLAPYRVTKPSD